MYEGAMTLEALQSLIPKIPFSYVHYDNGSALEDQRQANGASGMEKNIIGLLIGTASLRTRTEKYIGAHKLIDQLKKEYNGKTLVFGDGETITLGFVSRNFVLQQQGLVEYYIMFQYFDC
jgi:hypothetical protein